jgi:hypothetical protein
MQRSHVDLGCLLAGLLAIFSAAPCCGGDKKKDDIVIPPVKLGPEHEFLASLVGAYDANVKFFMDPAKPPAESTGVMTRKLILDGNFLQESYRLFFRQTFRGTRHDRLRSNQEKIRLRLVRQYVDLDQRDVRNL